MPAQTTQLLVEEADDLASDVLSASLLVVHDAGRGGEHNVAELTRWQQVDNPLLEVAELDVVAWGDDTALVQAAVELDDNLAVAVVIDLLELANVAC
jgi:hypothetical protein